MTNLSGYIVAAPGEFLGELVQFGNFPNPTNPFAPGQPTPEESYRRGYTSDGHFYFRDAQVSVGQEVLFDVALGGVVGIEAVNIRVP